MPVVQLTAPAARQLAQARDWWLEHRDKAPWALDQDIDGLILLLEERPELIGRPVESMPAVRRVFLRRVRYFVYFEIVDEGDRVEILAVWHASRGSDPDL
jgi:plasmid stabilization system protein ParE